MSQQYHPGSPPSASQQEVKTLWIGDIEQWMDENYINSLLAHTGGVVSVKIIRDKVTQIPAGYGFIEFSSHYAASQVLESYNGQPIPGTGRVFRLNWATFGVADKRRDGGPEFSVFVGDLGADATDYMLHQAFTQRYTSVKGAKVVCDPQTGLSKGYGFVRFGDEHEKDRAMSEMQGVYCGSRPMRISTATPKKATAQPTTTPTPAAYPAYSSLAAAAIPAAQPVDSNDPTNTTIFVGNLDPSVEEDTLRTLFTPFGSLVNVKIPSGKGCGFVQFVHRSCAENALATLHGSYVGNQRVRLSWGRSAQTTVAPAATTSSATTAAPDDPASAYYNYYSRMYDPAYYSYYGAQSYGASASADGNSPTQQNLSLTQGTEKVIDFTQPPDIHGWNEEFVDERTDQFLHPWQWRNAHGLTPDPDGPDPILFA
jgi:RNA recognition motif-containing protein